MDPTVLSFELAAQSHVATFFSAECTVKSADTFSFVTIDILVDGEALPPTDSDDAFCTGHGNDALRNHVSAATSAVAPNLAPGPHEIEMRSRLVIFNAGEEWNIDDISLIAIATSTGTND